MERPSETVIEVKRVRKEIWREAMQKSNGTINDTYEIYDELCSFP